MNKQKCPRPERPELVIALSVRGAVVTARGWWPVLIVAVAAVVIGLAGLSALATLRT